MDDAATALLVTCCLAREIGPGDVVGVGLGTPAGLAAALLAQRTSAPDAVVVVSGAISPRADVAECMAGAGALGGRAAGFVSHLDSMEMAERQAMTLQFLRPAQVDQHANLNVSRVGGEDGGWSRLPGGLASADVTRLLGRIVLYHPDHRARSLPAQVAYRTAAGGGDAATGARGPVALVTDRAVLSFERGSWRVRSLHPGQGAESVTSNTGFRLEGVEEAPPTPPPTEAEIEALDGVDRHALRELDFRGTRAAAAVRLARLNH